MGVDIDDSAGVVVSAAELAAAVVTPANCKQSAQLLLQLTCKTLAELKKRFDADLQDDDQYKLAYQCDQSLAAMLVDVFDQLSVQSTVGDIRGMLASMTECVADGCYTHGKRAREAIVVWKCLLGGLFPETAYPEIIAAFFKSPRDQGRRLPAGEVHFVFSAQECFERTKTAKGKALDQILGKQTDLSIWPS